MKKKLLAVAVSTAMMSSLAFFGSALAADRVEVKVTSEPIQSRSTCDKVGGFSLEFDSGTILLSGDRITIDTDYVTPANFTELCRSVDILIAPDNTGSDQEGQSGLAWNTLTTPVSTLGNSPVYFEGLVAPIANNGGVNFHVYGNAGTQRITFDVIGQTDLASALIVGADIPDKIVVKFLDQAVNADFTTPGIWINDVAEPLNIYESPALIADNTLCLDVSSWDAATVSGNMDSTADKYTFIPSDPQIAHIVAAATYTVEECKGANCGTVPIGGDVAQSEPTCESFTDSTGYLYCTQTNQHFANDLIIKRGNGAFAADDYQIVMEILVNGETGDNGAYFASEVATAGADTEDAACAAEFVPLMGTSFYLESGADATINGATGCDVAPEDRAVSLVTAAGDLDLNGTTNDFLNIAIPTLVYDAGDVSDQDAVTVRVTLTRAPCGTLITTEHCVGTMVGACSILPEGNTVNYPYFTEANGDGFWDGIVVTNLSAAAGEATLTMYEADGDVAVATVAIDAQSMFVGTLETMIADGTFVQTGGTGTLGDARSQIVASSETLSIDGFAMMGNNSTGVSMGYLPRVR
jgi:hypothetical protein